MKRLLIFPFIFSLFLSGAGYTQHTDSLERQKVKDASQQPFRNVCLIKAYRIDRKTNKEEIKHFTGFLISPRFILTCAHVVMQKGSTIEKIVVYPFVNGSIKGANSISFNKNDIKIFMRPGFAINSADSSSSADKEYGGFLLPNESVYQLIGSHFKWDNNYQFLQDNDSPQVYIAGYPSDKWRKKKTYFEMWTQKGRILKKDSQCMQCSFKTKNGNSGSPIWIMNNGVPIIVGIHSLGGSKGVRINKKVYDEISKWMNSQ